MLLRRRAETALYRVSARVVWEAIYRLLVANAYVVGYECYFNEPDPYRHSSLNTGQNPKAAGTYRRLW